MKAKSNKFLWVYFALWMIALVFSGINPKDRLTWWLEVAPVLIGAPLIWWTRKSFPLPAYLHVVIFIHGLILILGGHYTYAEVPLGRWFQEWFELKRNHFDRLGHFVQGVTPSLISYEIFSRKVKVRSRAWLAYFMITTAMAFSVSYEFIEWAAALLLDAGSDAFLATQGDIWDTQWDMWLATIGAGLSAALVWNRKLPKGSS